MVYALILAVAVAAPPLQRIDGHFTREEVVTVDAPAGDLYARALTWGTAQFGSPKAFEAQDPVAHQLIARLTDQVLGTAQIYEVYYTLTIETKDGRYRVTAADFLVGSAVKTMFESNKPLEDATFSSKPKWMARLAERVEATFVSLHEGMARRTVKSDW